MPVAVTGFLGSGADNRVYAAPVYVAPSSPANTYYAVTDANLLCCTPALGYVFAGTNAPAPPASTRVVAGEKAYVDDANISAKWNLTVPPGQTVSLMHFVIQRDSADAAGAKAQAEALANLTDPNALFGMTDAEKAQVINFQIPIN